MASLLQVGRNTLQKSLKITLNDWTITWIRFFYGLPVILIYYLYVNDLSFSFNWVNSFFLWLCLGGGICQILGTYFMMKCFTVRQFAISISYTKLESIFAALIGVVFFADYISWFGLLLIIISIVGILLISSKKYSLSFKNNFRSTLSSGSMIGILSGLSFAAASVFFRQANLSLPILDTTIKGINTLLVVVFIQTVILTVFLMYKDIQLFLKSFQLYQQGFLTGFFGISASTLWFISFGLANAAYIKAVGSIDIIFSLLVGFFVFKESLSLKEILGIILILFSVLLFMFL